jgi:hypothetical protein
LLLVILVVAVRYYPSPLVEVAAAPTATAVVLQLCSSKKKKISS